jgi:hypothetical protein
MGLQAALQQGGIARARLRQLLYRGQKQADQDRGDALAHVDKAVTGHGQQPDQDRVDTRRYALVTFPLIPSYWM